MKKQHISFGFAESGNQTLAIKNARIVVGDGNVIENGTVIIKGNRIKKVTQEQADVEVSKVIDAKGMTLMPGLIDTHVHFFVIVGKGEEAFREQIKKMAPHYLQKYLRHGVTTVRSMTDPLDLILEFKEMVNNGEIQGPRILAVGPSFTAPDGHPASTIGKTDPYCRATATIEVDIEEEAKQEVLRLKDKGVDAIKVVLDGFYNGEAIPKLSNNLLLAIVDEAHKNDLKVFAHTHMEEDVRDAINAGVDGIEHGVCGEAITDNSLADLLKQKEIVFTPTLWIMNQNLDSESMSKAKYAKQNLKYLSDRNIKLAFGTDAPALLGAGTAEIKEMEYLAEAGLSPEKIIQIATKNSADSLGLLDQIGTVEAGKVADLILVDGDPLHDITTMQNIQIVIKSGKVVYDQEMAEESTQSVQPNPVSWFEIPVLDMSRAVGFYEYVFGINLKQESFGPVEMAYFPADPDAPGATGMLIKIPGEPRELSGKTGGVIIYFSTKDIDATIQRIKGKGGKVHATPFTLDGKSYKAIVEDTEGNVFGIQTVD